MMTELSFLEGDRPFNENKSQVKLELIQGSYFKATIWRKYI